jgi:homoserine kinase
VDWIGKNLPVKKAVKSLSGLNVELQNEIPIGVGLGSSAAAIVAGSLLGAELCGVKLSSKDLLRMALEIEGHPDNLAAAVHGGFVVAAALGGSASDLMVAKTAVSSALDFVAVVPGVLLPTAKSRAALPKNYSRADVVNNLQRTALLTAAFFSGERLSPELFADRLHQPYRSPLVPGIAECLEYRHDGLLGIFLSGAGSSIMAIVEHGAASIGKTATAKSNAKIQANNAKEIGDALVAEFAKKGTQARAIKLKADNRGTRVTGSGGPRTFPVPQR